MNFSRNQILFGVFLVAALVVLGHYSGLYSAVNAGSCQLARPSYGNIVCQGAERTLAVNADGGLTGSNQLAFEPSVWKTTDINTVYAGIQPTVVPLAFDSARSFSIGKPVVPDKATVCWGRIQVRDSATSDSHNDLIYQYSSGTGVNLYGSTSEWTTVSNAGLTARKGQFIAVYPAVCVDYYAGSLGSNQAILGAHGSYVSRSVVASYVVSGERWVANFDSARDQEIPGTDGCVNQGVLASVRSSVSGQPDASSTAALDSNSVLANFGVSKANLPTSDSVVPVARIGSGFPFIQYWVSDIALNRFVYKGQDAWVTPGVSQSGTFAVYATSQINATDGSCFIVPSQAIGSVGCTTDQFCTTQVGAGYVCDSTGNNPSFTCKKSDAFTKVCKTDLDCGGSGSTCVENTLTTGACVNSQCVYSKKQTACCPGDYSCASTEYCSVDAGYVCKAVGSGKIPCQTECCFNYQNFDNKACSNGLQCVSGSCVSSDVCAVGEYINTLTNTCSSEPQCKEGETNDRSVMPHVCKVAQGGGNDNTLLYVLIGVIVLVVVGYFLTKKPQGKR